MTTQALPRTEDLTETCWRDDAWFHSFGLLSPSTVLDYFALSPFYDNTSNNEAARQRGLKLEQLAAGAPGIEFILQDAQPPHLFVVRKQFRSLSGVLTNLAYYYVLDGTIYQAPSLYATMSCRLERCVYTLNSAFKELRSDLDPLGPRGEDTRNAEITRALQHTSQNLGSQIKGENIEATREQHHRAERMILSALFEHPLPIATFALKQHKEKQQQLENACDGAERMDVDVGGTVTGQASLFSG